jgi:thiamine pyrophosphokinase
MRGEDGAAPPGGPAGGTGPSPHASDAGRRAAVFLNGEYVVDAEQEGAAAFYGRRFAEAALRIAADGGYAALRALGLRPEVLVGDFDSLAPEALVTATAEGVEIVRLPVRKDETDAEAAVALALRRGATAVDLLGGFGGALDHELGNLAVLSPSRTTLSSPPATRVSLLSLTETALVTLAGLEYPLDKGLLRAGSCLGVSNAVRQAGARIDVHEGEVLALVFADGEAFAPEAAGA